MDKLQWFKFSPVDWIMGKIQRCPETTQARFVRLICLYWNKECVLSFDDAEIEIDKEHLDILISKKIISNTNGFINISFLDEQFAEIESDKNLKSQSGIVGNLKRWHNDIYKKYEAKKISLKEAIEQSKSIATQSHTDSTPIATQSQNIADKIREDKKRKENNIPEFSEFLTYGLEKEKLLCENGLKLKYDAWIENGWKDGNQRKIINWKSKLLNTIQYLPKKTSQVPDAFKNNAF